MWRLEVNIIAPGASAAPAGPNPSRPVPQAVREATVADEPEIIRLLHLMHAEGGLVSLDVGRAREMFARAFTKQGGIIGVIGPPDDIQGMIYLLITRFWYSADFHLEELFCFVRADHRRSGHSKTLIAFAKTCAEKLGIPLAIGVMTNARMAAKVRLYRRMLGPPTGAYFVFNSGWCAAEPPAEDFWKEPSRPTRQRETASEIQQGQPQ
jgi:GNAT superfamily N-acetyltransferase